MANRKKVTVLFLSLALCFLPGIIGGLFTRDAITSWYVYLNKPPFNPPNWLFGPVWTILYFLMGIALYLVKTSTNEKFAAYARTTVIFFLFHLLVNALWSIIFFGFHNPLLALVDILILWLMIIILIRRFYRIRPNAGLLLMPYLAWVSFASILNGAIWILN